MRDVSETRSTRRKAQHHPSRCPADQPWIRQHGAAATENARRSHGQSIPETRYHPMQVRKDKARQRRFYKCLRKVFRRRSEMMYTTSRFLRIHGMCAGHAAQSGRPHQAQGKSAVRQAKAVLLHAPSESSDTVESHSGARSVPAASGCRYCRQRVKNQQRMV